MSNYNPYSLQGKTILVTGASSGIGRATAIECSKLGACVIALGRNEQRLEDLRNILSTEYDVAHQVLQIELTNQQQVEDLVAELPVIDGLVNCAGIGSTWLFQSLTRDKLNQIFDVNFFSPVELSRLILKKKKISRGGSIVFISSIDGPINTHIANSSYGATKAALAAIARGMAVELASKQIRVNYVMPGQTETPLIHNDSITEEQLAVDMAKYPLKRYGRPEEIAFGVIYFLSDASTFTTGAGLVIDGGFTLI